MVNPLMFQPLNDFEVFRSINLITADAAILLKLIEPPVDKLSRIIIIGVKKAREHSRGRARPPFIIGNCPELDK